MITTKDGLLFKDGRMLSAPEADRIANTHGFQFAEYLVKHLQKTTQLAKDLHKAVQLRVFQTTLENAWNRAQCAFHGHNIEDCSHAGPNSGDMDHQCTRCGKYWSITLY